MTGTITRDDAVEVLNGMLDPLRSKLSGRSRLSLRDVRQLENTVDLLLRLRDDVQAAAHPDNLEAPRTASAAFVGTIPPQDVVACVPWVRHHPAKFGRAAIHAACRVNSGWSRMGRVAPEGVWDAKSYGLSATESYVSAFWDEPQRLTNMTLQQVVAEPVPAAVDALIRVDTKRYLDDLMVWYQSELKERREAEGTPVPTTTLPGG